MSVTMSADAHTQMTNQINALGSEVRELKKQLALYEEDPSKLCATMDDHVENYLDDQGITCSLEELCEAYNDLKTSAQTTENYWKSKFEAVEQSTESSAYQELEIERLKKNEKAYENKIFSLNQEIESLKKSNKQKTKLIHRFREQVKGLDKVMLSSAFQSWREVQCATNPQYTIQDEIDFLNGETTNQELINEVFEDLYPYEYEYDAKNKTYIDHNSDTTSDEE